MPVTPHGPYHRDEEDARLVACLRAASGGPEPEGLRQWSAETWQKIARRAGRQRIAPLIFRWIKTGAGDQNIPQKAIAELRSAYLETSAQNTRLRHQLGQVLEMLGKQGIAVAPIKGAHLAECYYADIALRPMGDIDLLVHKADVKEAEACLKSLGYELRGGRDWYLEEHYHIAYTPPQNGPSLEIHWHVIANGSPFSINIEDVWQRMRPGIIAGHAVSLFSPEDVVLYLCLHASYQHGFGGGLLAFYDIAQILRQTGDHFDWELVLRLARAWRVEKCAAIALHLTQEWLGAPIPAAALDQLCESSMREEKAAMAATLTLRRANMPRDLAKLWGGKGLREKAAAVWRNVFLPRDLLADLYPVAASSPRIYFYYLVHFKNLCRRYGPTVWQLLRKDPKMIKRMQEENQGDLLHDWLEPSS